jgi:hypothetical protein
LKGKTMTATFDQAASGHPVREGSAARRPVQAPAARLCLILAVAAGAGAGFAATGQGAAAHAIAAAGPDLTRLLRAMAVIKVLLAGLAGAAVFWRLGGPVGLARLAAYAAASFAMAAGPGLIWGMCHFGAGALLLHGGLLATILLLWRDPATARLLDGAILKRRAVEGAIVR